MPFTRPYFIKKCPYIYFSYQRCLILCIAQLETTAPVNQNLFMLKKNPLIVLLLCLCAFNVSAQKKYNSLLWEISGNGLKKPSYLYGTMHVSNKLAFRLGEPFYKAISESDVVATEINPDTWFESFITSEEYKQSMNMAKNSQSGRTSSGEALQNDRALMVQNAFQQDLSAINQLMYRISAAQANYEESTFLDLYIYKCGKKLNKKIRGVETYRQLMDGLGEASKTDENDREDEVPLNPKDKMNAWSTEEKIEEAYRRADLDGLDSLSHLGMSKREAEFILYKRNKIMGAFIDSVVKTQRLFLGVGAAHLPGEKGLIEWLRKKGYTVKPMDMGERDAIQRSALDSLIYVQKSGPYVAPDSFYSVTVPGKMLDMLSMSSMSLATAVDMVNGAYYTITRTLSASFINNETTDHVLSSLDSSFYEIVPGDIVSKKSIERFGYKGYDILNRTRRGDLQRTQLLVTPNEILIFKLNGTDNFASSAEADNFFNSISVKPAKTGAWKPFTAPDNSFSVAAPSDAFLYYSTALDNLDDRHLMMSSDTAGNRYVVLKHMYNATNYIECDSFDLDGMLESFAKKAKYKLDTPSYSYSIWHGRPVINATYTTSENRHIRLRTIISELNYYLLGVYYDHDTSHIAGFLESFAAHNHPYDSFTWYKDTALQCKVKLPYVPNESVLSNALSYRYKYKSNEDEEKTKSFYKPGYDERIDVSFAKYDRYLTMPDTTFFKKAKKTLSLNNYQVLNRVKTVKLKDGWQIDALVSDTGSTQLIHKRLLLKNGTRYLIQAYVDTLLGESDFVKTFFETFTPKDTVIGLSPLSNKGAIYLKDLYSSDTALQNKAINYTGYVRFAKTDVPGFINAVKNLPKTKTYKDYVDLKMNLFENFAVSDDARVTEFLKSEYPKYSDTATYQYAILQALAQIKTPASIAALKDLITTEQPLGEQYHARKIFMPLIDSPELVKDYFADLYSLSSIEDYKPFIIRLMAAMNHKGLLKPEQYKDKLPALLSEARNEYKRSEQSSSSYNSYEDRDEDNSLLSCYNKLLIPFMDSNTGVKNYFDKLLKQGSEDLRIELASTLLSKGKPVSDSVLNPLAANEMTRITLYSTMLEDSVANKFPSKYAVPDSFAYSLVMTAYVGSRATDEDKAKDTIILLDKKPLKLFDEEGMVYFYKVKTGKSKFWSTEVVGLQPKDGGKPLRTYNQLNTKESYYLDNAKNIRAQFDESLDEIIKHKIKHQNPYYKKYADFTMQDGNDYFQSSSYY